ncbi:hypothetical protein BOX15_Mlig003427g1 [Macrostomum lignano]|uniref:Uncharacterized protein n=1 Tax=Macrostomum lignano TaxID=282301 RepID=A0A267FC83_9PLAT|nr:hypothetical protein BOX15_Mlig003427g1 [Macrostomum lignano]
MKDLPPETLAAYKPMRTTPTMTDSQRQLQEEVETKALEVLSAYLPELVKRHSKRKRFRKLCAEERPWRSDMCLVLGLAHFGNFISKFDLRLRQLGIPSNIHKSSYMDPEWFTMDSVGALLFNWQRAKSGEDTSGPAVGLKAARLAPSGSMAAKSSMDRAAAACLGNPTAEDFLRNVKIVAVVGNEEANRLAKEKLFKDSEESAAEAAGAAKVPRSARGAGKKGVDFEGGSGGPPVTPAMLYDCLDRSFRCLRRAAVLAGRGGHWSLLLRCGQTVWSCLQTALMQVGCHQQAMDSSALRRTAWEAMSLVCDYLCDCLQSLQAEAAAAAVKRVGASLPTDLPPFNGGPELESGGASLRFDADMDDASTVDLRWLRKFVLATLEVLHQERRWERLVDLGLRFNAVTNNRYCELTTPLIVKAQRSLVDRVLENGGPPPPQPHYRFMLRQREDRPIGSRDYLELQLVTAIDKRKLQPKQQPTQAEQSDSQQPQRPADEADEAADVFARDPHEIYENGLVARQLSCVPLDMETSLDEFRQALDATSSTSKSLRHARQLALLYMAGQQEGVTGFQRPSSSGVQFRDVTDKPPTSMPPDRRTEKFAEAADCTKLPLPKSQLPVVVEAYEKAIELLSAKKQRSLAAQAYRELGCLLLHLERPRDALFYWSECLDCLLGVEDALNNWHSVVGSSDAPSVLMQRCGVWGCILGGIAASNIAQYIMSSDLGLRLDCCFLAAGFFKGLFRSSLPHPLSDREYAMYDIGEQCEVTNLMPGVSLLGNRFRADVRVWEAALSFVIEELSRAGHNTAVLPLLSLYLFLVTGLARDLHRSVKGRIKRLEVLTSLSLYSEACATLKQLLWGERLPQLIDSKFRTTETKPPKFVFNAAKSLLCEENLHAVDKLSHRRLTPALAALYGHNLVCKVTVAQASLLCSIASTVQALPEKISFDTVELDPALLLSPERGRRGGGGGAGGGGAKRSMAGKFQTEDLKQPKSPIGLAQLALQQQSRQLTPEILKFLLLRASGDSLQAILDSLLPARDDDDQVSAALNATELELAVNCLLGLSRAARERHHARTAARFAQRALRLLAMSDLLSPNSKVKRPQRPQLAQQSSQSPSKQQQPSRRLTSEEELENFASRSRLDARTWLNCRLALADSLLCEIRGMGNVKGAQRDVYVDVPDARAAILQGIGETEMLGDAELKRDFQFRLATLDLLEGRPTPQVLESLMAVNAGVSEAEPAPTKSPQSEASALTKILCSALIADLLMCQSLDPQELDKALLVYSQGQERLLKLIEQRGETIEHHLKHPVRSAPTCPMSNIYLPEYLLLVELKLRIAYTLAKMGSQESIKTGRPKELWTEAVGLTATALELSQAVANRSAMLESELWTVLGKLQLQLHLLGYFSQKTVAKTLYEALKSVIHSHHDLAAIRQLYLDLALLHLFGCGLVSVASNGALVGASADDPASTAAATSPTNSPKTTRRKAGGGGGGGGAGKRKALSKKEKDEALQREATDVQKDRRAAWVAIKCAARVGAAQRNLSAIVGESNGNLTLTKPLACPNQQPLISPPPTFWVERSECIKTKLKRS